MDTSTDTLTAGVACQIVGVPYQTLHRWIREGLLKPTEDPGGSGHFRQFSVRDTLELAFVSALRGIGASRALTAQALHALQQWLDAGIPERLWLVARDTNEVYWAEEPEAATAAAGSHTAIILDVAALARETAAAFEQELQAQLASNRRRR